MDYGVVGKSAVPHVTTLGQHFLVPYKGYMFSLIAQCSFIILILPLLAIWIYFSAKYKKPKLNQQEQQKGEKISTYDSGDKKKQASMHASQIDHRQQNGIHEDEQLQMRASRANSFKKSMQSQYGLDSAGKAHQQQIKKKLEIAERRICYGVCFFALHVIAANSLDSGILSIVTFYLTAGLFVIFNLIKPKKNAILLGLYMAPVVASAFSCWLGSHLVGIHTT